MQHVLASAVIAVLLAGVATPAAAQRLIASLSNHRVMVTSSFTGAELVLFGFIETASPRRGGYDIVATVVGPRRDMVTYRKGRMFGIWVNADSRVFEKAPTYLAVLANRPLDAIANAETRRKLQLGLDNIALPQRPDHVDPGTGDPFREAFMSLNQDRGVYLQAANGITFLAPTLFRATIPLPSGVPVGNYEVDVRLFVDGNLIARSPSAFEVYKAGFEQFVTASVRNHSFLYGISTATMALAIGWLASIVFRRD
ncbi:MAG: TIGR02186 family protein [Xanthobacteraceae bacterium]